jgi:hypothetical protein
MQSYIISYEYCKLDGSSGDAELMINAESLKEALESFQRDYHNCRLVDFRGGDVLQCDDCEYKDSASCFDTVFGTVCPKCGSKHVSGTA